MIFASAPHVNWLRGSVRMSGALAGITAAIVGSIARVALRFALRTLFGVTLAIERGLLDFDLPLLSGIRPTACSRSLPRSPYFGSKLGIAATLGGTAALGMLLGKSGHA